jgi:hypothetical protein
VEAVDFRESMRRRARAVAAVKAIHERPRRSWPSPAAVVFTAAIVAILVLGWKARDLELLSAETGAGYALGVTGGALIVSLLLYPLRKRWSRIRHYGELRSWFRVHMVLGIVGPVCILFHANFRFGSTNSNVALVSMLTVVASGIAGRYLYGKVHYGLYGHRMTLEELRDALALDRNALTSLITTSPQVLAALSDIDDELKERPPGLVEAWRRGQRAIHRAKALRWVLAQEVPIAVAHAADARQAGMLDRYRARRAVRVRAKRYVRAVRATALFTVYERVLAAWHILHVPLFVLLLFAGIVHVVAVHAY